MKMYILVRDSVHKGCGINSVGHASLKCYLEFKDTPEMKNWLSDSFKKVTCKVSDTELEEARNAGDYVEINESFLDDSLMCLAFKPREEYPESFSKYRLYS